jgi:ketosteroid isomerase-like protein
VKNVHLEPKAVQVFNDVAVVCYTVTDTYAKTDGSREEESIHITHIWRKTNGTWQYHRRYVRAAPTTEIVDRPYAW